MRDNEGKSRMSAQKDDALDQYSRVLA